MQRKLSFAGVALLLIGGTGRAPHDAWAQTAPPPAQVRTVTDTLHGVAVADPYRWMEAGGPEFATWLEVQDAYTRSVLERIPGREKVLAEMRALNTDATTVSRVERIGGEYFYLKRIAGEQVAKLYVGNGGQTAERVLVDPAALGDTSHRFTITEYAPSPDGRYVVVHVAPNGGGVGTFRVVEVPSSRAMPEVIGRAFYFNAWRPDGGAFAYTRLRDLPPDTPAGQLELCAATYLHVVGSDPAADQPLLGCGISPRVSVAENQVKGVTFPAGSRYALAWVASYPLTAVSYYAAPTDSLVGSATPWRRLTSPDDQVSSAVLHGDTAYLVTHRDTPRSKIVRTSVLHPDLEHADVVVPQSEAVIALRDPSREVGPQGLYVASDAVYAQLLDAGLGRLLRIPFDGGAPTQVPLPFTGAIHDVSADARARGVVFSLETWTRQPRIYAFDPASSAVPEIRLAPRHPADRPEFTSTELTVRSADGARVPLSIVAPPNVRKDGSHPAVVEAYGAAGIVYGPRFDPSLIPWLERNGIYAVCHARGGGEFGEEWHLAGQKLNKANTIADHIACAEYLIAQGYTTRARLAAVGGSAGGLAVGGFVARRPDLLAAAGVLYPLVDLLRYEFSRNGPAGVPEFGTVKDPDEFRAMVAVSPYANIEKGTRYPAVLLTTGINDTRVPPWQAAKFAARLQAATASGKPVLLRVDWGSGHGMGTTAADQESAVADAFTFVLWQMGVPEFQPRTGSRR